MTWKSFQGKQCSGYHRAFLCYSVLSYYKIFSTFMIYVSNIGEVTFIGYFQIETLMVSQFISTQLICLGLLCIRDLRHCEFSFSFALGERGLKTQFKLQLCRLIGSAKTGVLKDTVEETLYRAAEILSGYKHLLLF